MTITIICIAFITGVAIRFIWEVEVFRDKARFYKDCAERYWDEIGILELEKIDLIYEIGDLRAELAKYKRPRNPKTGRFL